MLKQQKLAVLGAGQMGEALCKGFIDAGIIDANQILVSDSNLERFDHFKNRYGIISAPSNSDAVAHASIILLAIKPQQISSVLNEIRDKVVDNAIVISIAAGITTNKIESELGKNVRVVRVMPNTPALVGEGMSAISRGTYADDEAINITSDLFFSVGDVIELLESQLDKVTAISGSGPAYFFLMVESLIDAAINAGLDHDVAIKLVNQTLYGSAILVRESEKDAGELREMVTSPGGTTAAALQVFSNREFRSIVQEAVDAAIHRAKELA